MKLFYNNVNKGNNLLDFVLSNKYTKFIIECLKFEILNEKDEVLFDFFILCNKASSFSFQISSSRHYMMTFKYLFDRAKFTL